jgi:hypothetical protein
VATSNFPTFDRCGNALRSREGQLLGSGPAGSSNNLAVLLSNTQTPASLLYSTPNTTDFTNTSGAITLSATSLAMLGNRNANNRGFKGSIDDVRIYDNLLTTSDLATVQQEAGAPLPEPAVLRYLSICAAAALRRRRLQHGLLR